MKYRRALIIGCEFLVVYGLLGIEAYTRQLLSEESFYLLVVFIGLGITFYYGITGASLSVVCSGFLVFLRAQSDLLGFFLLHSKEATLFVSTLLIVGLIKYSLQKRIMSLEAAAALQAERIDHLRIELSEKDKRIQDDFREVLTEMESPTILYHAIRRIADLPDKREYLNETLQVLYTYCHVEKSSIYEINEVGKLERVIFFGMSSLPDVLEWGREEMPEVVRVAMTEKDVIIPKIMNNRLSMVIPLLSVSQDILYVIVIEEIRFINFTPDLINLLKIAALWIKLLLEHKLHRSMLLPFSAYPSVIVYKSSFAKEFLEEITDRYKTLGVPYAIIRMTIASALTEKKCQEVVAALRLYDEIFMISTYQLIVLLTMTTSHDLSNIIKRLHEMITDVEIEEVKSMADIVYESSFESDGLMDGTDLDLPQETGEG